MAEMPSGNHPTKEADVLLNGVELALLTTPHPAGSIVSMWAQRICCAWSAS
jgi:hypothetical protein